jgi:lipopolysaccharide biosynthesis glycosyltransferase
MPTPITLVTVSNNDFAVLLAAMLKSLDVTHKSTELIHCYVVDDGLSAANRAKLARCISSPNIELRWVKIEDAFAGMAVPLDNSSFPVGTYVRLCAPYFVKNAERIIYLDSDMILLSDIAELWQIDLQGHVVGAAIDRAEKIGNPWGGVKNYAALGLDPEAKYLNAGLLVIDVAQWLAIDLTGQVFRCIEENKEFAAFADQYGLNVVLTNKWLELDSRWNCMPMAEIEKPFLIHFIGVKPIFTSYSYNPAYQQLFFDYLNQTEWRGYQPLPESKRLLRKAFIVFQKKLALFVKKAKALA